MRKIAKKHGSQRLAYLLRLFSNLDPCKECNETFRDHMDKIIHTFLNGHIVKVYRQTGEEPPEIFGFFKNFETKSENLSRFSNFSLNSLF